MLYRISWYTKSCYKGFLLYNTRSDWDSNSTSINSSSAVTRIIQENQVNTMATDDLAPYVTRASVAMVLTVENKWVLGALSISKCHLTSIYMYRDFHYKDKTVTRPSYLYNGNLHIWKDSQVYIETGPLSSIWKDFSSLIIAILMSRIILSYKVQIHLFSLKTIQVAKG